MKQYRIIGYAALALLTGVDRIIKQSALSSFEGSVLLTREYAGVFTVDDAFGKALGIMICVGVSIHAVTRQDSSRLFHTAILLGAFSNLFDRFVYGGVIDWLLLPMARINAADILIIGGTLGLFMQVLKSKKK